MNYEQRTTNNELRTTNYFLQNKPNFPNAQMNITSVNTMNYELRLSAVALAKAETMNYFMQNKPNQTQPVVSLSNLSQTTPAKRFQQNNLTQALQTASKDWFL